MFNKLKGEPAILFSLINAILALAITFGLDLTQEQVGSILAVSAILLGITIRSKVSPVNPEKII